MGTPEGDQLICHPTPEETMSTVFAQGYLDIAYFDDDVYTPARLSMSRVISMTSVVVETIVYSPPA